MIIFCSFVHIKVMKFRYRRQSAAKVLPPSVGIAKTRKRVQQARNRRKLFMDMDEHDFEQPEQQETLREVEQGHDAMDIFLADDWDDEEERQVKI